MGSRCTWAGVHLIWVHPASWLQLRNLAIKLSPGELTPSPTSHTLHYREQQLASFVPHQPFPSSSELTKVRIWYGGICVCWAGCRGQLQGHGVWVRLDLGESFSAECVIIFLQQETKVQLPSRGCDGAWLWVTQGTVGLSSTSCSAFLLSILPASLLLLPCNTAALAADVLSPRSG